MGRESAMTISVVALEFCKYLICQNFSEAVKLLSSSLRGAISENSLGKRFKRLADGAEFDHCEIVTQMEDWPDRILSDIAWLYVSLEGDYIEGIALTVGIESGQFVITSIEWGRP